METKKNKSTLVLSGIIVVLLILLWFKSCNSQPETIKVNVPEATGSFETTKVIHDTIFLTKTVKSKPISVNDEFAQSEIDRLLKEYNELNDAFANANDSLQQIIYAKTIAAKQFSHTFDNDTLNATVKGIVANGEVDKLKLDYKIKSRTIETKIPQTTFRLLGGIEIGNSLQLDQFVTKANLGFQNKKGNVVTLAVDTDQRFYVGYQFSIFSLKK